MPGSGKSTLGKILARKLGIPFADSDKLVVARCGQTVVQMFATNIAHFRRVERYSLIDLATSSVARVIAVGGGGFCDDEARSALLKNCECCWLNCSREALFQRLKGSKEIRPLMEGGNKLETLIRLMNERSKYYTLAHHKVQIEAKNSPRNVANIIMHKISNRDRLAKSD